MPTDSIYQVFKDGASKYGAKPLLFFKKNGRYRHVSWSDTNAIVTSVARWLSAKGIAKGQRVAIFSENRPEWAYADLAILALGAINVPIYSTDSPGEAEYILKDSSSKAIFLSTDEQLRKILEVRKNLPDLKYIISFDIPDRADDEHVYSLDKILSLARSADAADTPHLPEVGPHDIASIIYTSGTTGEPKGVMLTHDNFLSNCRSCSQVLDFSERDISLSILPLSHVFERMAGYYMLIMHGVAIAYAENMNKVSENLKEIRPTAVCAVPRLFEKIYARIFESALASSPIKRALFFWALKIGRRLSQKRFTKKGMSGVDRLKRALLDLFIFKKVHAAFGGRLRFFVSGGAPLSKDIAEFFYATGIVILEGYGLTETSPVIAVNTLSHTKLGTVGRPVPGIEVKIADDGEILTKGPHVMMGYYKKEAETNLVLNDGWFHTGDIGNIDEDGYLAITDRKKDIIITSGGKNIAPQKIENILKADRFISEAVVYGDKRSYIVALIVPDFDSLVKYAEHKKISYGSKLSLLKDPLITRLIDGRIERACRDLANFEKVKKFALLESPFSQSKGEITPTMKIKRKAIYEIYGQVIDGLYK
ncbi:MAG: hypothetical protein AUJ75_04125 [Candidatus Omnitrophica bacterium CG1_02_49_10]|nr:MAG: hypothetical protein AUJ75_04125 [Candidatus Omnitrophica bacterium CG1_02_49_10]